jgi:hypothetical protein
MSSVRGPNSVLSPDGQKWVFNQAISLKAIPSIRKNKFGLPKAVTVERAISQKDYVRFKNLLSKRPLPEFWRPVLQRPSYGEVFEGLCRLPKEDRSNIATRIFGGYDHDWEEILTKISPAGFKSVTQKDAGSGYFLESTDEDAKVFDRHPKTIVKDPLDSKNNPGNVEAGIEKEFFLGAPPFEADGALDAKAAKKPPKQIYSSKKLVALVREKDLKAIIKMGINGTDEQGRTPLMVAVVCKDLSLVRKLLENEADQSLHDKQGNSALSLSLDHKNNEELTSLLTLHV